MEFRFHVDSETGEPHCRAHGVDEHEVREVLEQPIEDFPGRDAASIALGQTEACRYLQVVYVADPEPDSVFVITAYELGTKAFAPSGVD